MKKESLYLDTSVSSAYYDEREMWRLEYTREWWRNEIPKSYFPDALHISFASFYKIDFLITWNCKHLADAHRRKRVRLFNASAGLFVPEIVTPMELVKEGEEDV